MKMKNIVMVVLGVALLVGLFVMLKPKDLSQNNMTGVVSSKEKVFKIVVLNKKIVEGESVLKVGEGDSVVIKLISDVADELHLHGYDKFLELQAGVEASLILVADITGRFEFELEKAGVELGVLEVLPKQ